MLRKFLICLVLSLSVYQISKAQVPGAPALEVNSDNPTFPFPQFLEYKTGKTLALYNGEGVTHCDMEQAIHDAYVVMMNRARYSGEVISGTKYIWFNHSSVPANAGTFVSEGDGYAMLAAAYMADKPTFDGLWMWIHDNRASDVISYETGKPLRPDYPYGPGTIGWKNDKTTGDLGGDNDAATDGDVDIALALLMAAQQWPGKGITDVNGKLHTYKDAAIEMMKTLTDTVFYDSGTGGDIYNDASGMNGYYSGDIGFDGYVKNGNTWGEVTNWANNGFTWKGKTWYPRMFIHGPDLLYTDYIAPGYFKQFHEFLKSEDPVKYDWPIYQYERAEASSDWMMGQMHSKGYISSSGSCAVSADGSATTFGPHPSGPAGEDFRVGWRTALNYLWHGNPTTSWNPVTHEVVAGGNTFEKDQAFQHAEFIKDPGICGTLGASPHPVSGSVHMGGISQIVQHHTVTGAASNNYWTNFLLGASAASVAAYGDEQLISDLYRQCELKWDDADPGTKSEIFRESTPKYFHGWFRLLGMLTLTGNLHAPLDMKSLANLKVYMSVDKTFAFIDDEVTYTINYRNYGSLDAKGSKIVVNVDEQYEITDAGGGTVSGNTITYNLGVVPGFKTATGIEPTIGTKSFRVKVVKPKVTDRVCQTAEISCTNGSGWTSNEYPNNCTYTMERNCVDILGERSLLVNKYGNREEINPGMEAEFTIQFENSSEGGWLNGGRSNVNLTYEWARSGPNSYFHIIRTFTNAAEAYIDLSNYRLSYFMFDNVNKGVYDAATNPSGWSFIAKNMQTGDYADFDFKGEDIPFGEDAEGKWDQRIILKFPPDITAPTHTIFSHLGNRFQLHKGTLIPIWYGIQMESNPPNPLFEGRLADDWSFDPDIEGAGSGNAAGTGALIGPSYADVNNLGLEFDRFDRDACTAFFGPDEIFRKVLIEEWDGYTWRRVAGEGPMPGREMYNVVIRDTLPEGLKFDRWIKQEAQGIEAKLITGSNGEEIIEWRMEKMLVGVNDSIRYVTIGVGDCPEMPDMELTNTAWIESETDSPTSSSADLLLTCGFVEEPVGKTTLEKTSDKEMYEVDDDIEYTIDFTQTIGSISKPTMSNASEWKKIDGGGEPSFNNPIGLTNNQFILQNKTHGTNGTLLVGIETSGSHLFGISLRNDGSGDRKKGIYLDFQTKYWGNMINLTVYENGKAIATLNQEGYSTPDAKITTIKIELQDNVLRLWVNKLDGLAFFTTSKITHLEPGYAGIGTVSWDSHKIHSWVGEFDSSFDLEIADALPAEVTYVSSSDGGTEKDGRVTWPKIPGPVLYDETIQHTLTATLNTCPDNGKVTNTAYVNAYGIAIDSLGAKKTVNCGGDVICPDPPIVTAIVSYCKDNEAEALTATANKDAKLLWYTTATGGKGSTEAPIPSTEEAGTVSYYVTQTEGGCESDRAQIDVVVTETEMPEIESPVNYCINNEAEELTAIGTKLKFYNELVGGDAVSSIVPGTDETGSTPYYVTQTIGGCESEKAIINVIVDETLPPTVTSPIAYCKGQDSEELTAEGTGTLNWYDDLTETTALNEAPIPSTDKTGTLDYYVSQTENGCESTREHIEVNVTEPETPTVISPIEYCQNATAEALEPNGTTYAWYEAETDGETIDSIPIPNTKTAGTFDFYVSEKAGVCESSRAHVEVIIKPSPTVTFTPIDPLCIDSEIVPISVTASPIGGDGTLTGTGVSGTDFDPSVALDDTHEITYEYTLDGCTTIETLEIEVQDKPDVDFDLPETTCAGNEVIELKGTPTGVGGIFTVTPSVDISTGFDPSLATAGKLYTITFDYTNSVCNNSISKEITVYNPPQPTGTNASAIYTTVTDQESVPELKATGVNLEWYDDEELTNLVGKGDSYQPDAAKVVDGTTNQGIPRIYTYYVISTDGGCKSEATTVTLEITACAVLAPEATKATVEVCVGSNNDEKQLEVEDTGNEMRWYEDGKLMIGEISNTFTPSQTKAGTYQFEVSQFDVCESPKTTITLIIHDLPTVSFTPPTEACAGDEAIDFSTYKSQEEGIITLLPALSIETELDPATAGIYEYSYEYTNATTNCSNSTTASIKVHALPVPVINSLPDMCEYDEKIDLMDEVDLTDGTFSGDGISGAQYFNPSLVEANSTANFTYAYTDETTTCTNTVEASIKVYGKPEITFSPITKSCENGEDVDLSAFVTPTTGEFKGTAVTETTFSPATSGVGTFPIDYIVTENGCTDTIQESAIVNELPIPTITAANIICINGEDETPVGKPSGGTFTFNGNPLVGNIEPSLYNTEDYVLQYDYTDPATNCSNSATKNIEIRELAPPTVADKTVLINPPVDLDITATPNDAANDIKWKDELGFAISTGATMQHNDLIEVNCWDYFAIETDGVCSSEPAKMTYCIIDCPTPAPTVDEPNREICEGDEIPTFSAVGTGTVTWYEDGIVVSNDSDFTPTPTGTGTGIFNYTVTLFDNNCEGIATNVSLTIHELPVVSITTNEVECINSGIVTPTLSPIGGNLKIDDITITNIDLSLYEAGDYTLSYEYTDPITNCYDSTTKTLEIREIPTPSVSDKTILLNETDISITATGNGGTLNWIDEGGNPIGDGSTIDHTGPVDVVGDYTYCVTETDGTCTSEPACMLFSVIDCPVPAPTITKTLQDACVNQPMPTLSATGTETIRWYEAGDLVNHVHEGSTYQPTITEIGSYTFYAAQFDGTCVGKKTSAIINVIEVPSPTITGNEPMCENGVGSTLKANVIGGTIHWYNADPASNSAIYTGNTFTPTFTDVIGTHDIWAIHEKTNSAGLTCFSEPTKVQAEVKPKSIPPTISTNNSCEGETFTMIAVGTDVNWYEVGETTPIEFGNIYTISNPTTLSYTMEATQNTNGCESDKISYTHSITERPIKPGGIDEFACFGAPAATLIATTTYPVTSFKWYTDSTKTAVGSTDSYTPASDNKNHTFYVTQTINGCESYTHKIAMNVIELPKTPTIEPQRDICFGREMPSMYAYGQNIKWYDASQTIVVGTKNSYEPVDEGAKTYTFYATQTIGVCESEFVKSEFDVIPQPTPPILSNNDEDIISCENDKEVVVATSQDAIQWIMNYNTEPKVYYGTVFPPSNLELEFGVPINVQVLVQNDFTFCQSERLTFSYQLNPKAKTPTVEPSLICIGQDDLTGTSSGSINTMWIDKETDSTYYGNSIDFSTIQTNDRFVYEFNVYDVLNECLSDVVEHKLVISPTPEPVIDGYDSLCLGNNDIRYFIKDAKSTSTYTWKLFGNGDWFKTDDANENIRVDWYSVGVDTIYAHERNKWGCEEDTTILIYIADNPILSFESNPAGNEGEISLTNLSEQPTIAEGKYNIEPKVSYWWNYDMLGQGDVQSNDKVVYPPTYEYGYHTIKLYAENNFGCKVETEEDIFINISTGFYVPSALAPTNPAHGVRKFKAHGFNLETFEMWIYDQWGNLIWYTNKLNEEGSPTEYWEGKLNGELLKSDVYIWEIEATFKDGSVFQGFEKRNGKYCRFGNVHLIR